MLPRIPRARPAGHHPPRHRNRFRAGLPARLISRLIAAALPLLLLLGVSPSTADAGWSRAPDLAICRSEHTAAALDGRVYVMGGLGKFGTLSSMEVLEPGADAWMGGAPLPLALHHTASAVLGDRIYVAGGYKGLFFNEPQWTLWAYHPASKSWERKADLPAFRAAHGMAAVDGMLYVAGGKGPGAKELWRYDPTVDRWFRGQAPLSARREHVAAAAWGGRLYIVGGRRGKRTQGTLERYDPAADRWTLLAPLPTPRGGLAAGVLDGLLHVTGGEDLVPNRTFALHEGFDPAAGNWSLLPPLPTARHGVASATLNGAWYVTGGAEGPGIRTLYTLSCRVDVYRR